MIGGSEYGVDIIMLTTPSHGGDRGSKPLGTTKDYRPLKKSAHFSPKAFPRIFPRFLGAALGAGFRA